MFDLAAQATAGNGRDPPPGGGDYCRASMVIRLVVAEDSLLVREGIVKLLGAYDDIEIDELCVDLPELLAAVDRCEPHVVLTDIRMPPTGTDEGIRAATELRERHPDVGVVVLSQYVEPTYALKLFDGGSQGRAYLLKERLSEGSQLISAIREVAAGGSVVDPKVVETLVDARSRAASSPLALLTPRELEVLSRDRPGREQRGRRPESGALRAGGGEAHQLVVLQARSRRGAHRPPTGQSRAALSRRSQTGELNRQDGCRRVLLAPPP